MGGPCGSRRYLIFLFPPNFFGPSKFGRSGDSPLKGFHPLGTPKEGSPGGGPDWGQKARITRAF